MKLILVRHGDAVNDHVDPTRPLSPKGRMDIKRAAEWLINQNIIPESIWHSYKTRARQTAEIMAEHLLPGTSAIEKPGLAPNDDVIKMQKIINQMTRHLMLVSHLPFLPCLCELLMGDTARDRGSLMLPTAGVIILKRKSDHTWEWHMKG